MKKYQLEFVLGKISKKSMWTMIGNNYGLSKWFADSVDHSIIDQEYIFNWGETSSSAKLLEIEEQKHIKFRWNEEHEDTYVQLSMKKIPLTNDLALQIVDFCEDSDLQGSVRLWMTHVEGLKRLLGCKEYLSKSYLY